MIPTRQASQRWTSGKALSRSLEILRYEGIKSLWIKALGETVHRAAALIARPLDEALPEVCALIPVSIDILKPGEVDEYMAFALETNESAVRRRLADGDWCFVARHKNRMVHAIWMSRKWAENVYLGIAFPLDAGDVYINNLYTLPGYRAAGVFQACTVYSRNYARAAGYKRTLALVDMKPGTAIGAYTRMGNRRIGTFGYYKLGPLRHDFVRMAPGQAPPGRSKSALMEAQWRKLSAHLDRHGHYLDAFLGNLKRDAYLRLIRRWTRGVDYRNVLKTDLFEEAMGPDAWLQALDADNRVGIDEAEQIVALAAHNLRREQITCLVADARALPFNDASFDLVVSPSTLDHFPDQDDLGVSLREIFRVTQPGGCAIVTLDNRQNVFDPLLRAVKWLGLIPYYLGRSYTVAELRRELEQAGFEVRDTTAIVHNPRLTAVAAVALARKLNLRCFTALVQRSLLAAQRMEHSRWRYRTGCFVAAKALRPERS